MRPIEKIKVLLDEDKGWQQAIDNAKADRTSPVDYIYALQAKQNAFRRQNADELLWLIAHHIAEPL